MLQSGLLALILANTTPRAYYDEGLSHLRARSAERAREQLSQLEALHPSDGHTSLLRGHCALMLEGDATHAEELYARALADGGEVQVEALHAFGRLYRQQQRWEEADERYAAAVAALQDCLLYTSPSPRDS